MDLCAEQAAIFETLVRRTSGACLITGDAGTGKTTLAAELVRAVLARGDGVQVLAPTHQAKTQFRMRLAEHDYLSIDTVATFLAQFPTVEKESGRLKFRSGAFGGTTARLVIVDETSMVSDHELTELLHARDEALVVFLGDFAQLRPVMKKQNNALDQLKTFYLREQHRNQSDILRLCNALRVREVWPQHSVGQITAHDTRAGLVDRFLRDITRAREATDACYLAYRNATVNHMRMVAHETLHGDVPFAVGQIVRLDAPCTIGHNGTLAVVLAFRARGDIRLGRDAFDLYEVKLRSLDDGAVGVERMASLRDQARMHAGMEDLYEASARAFRRDRDAWERLRALIERVRAITAHSSPIAGTVHKSQGRSIPRVYVDTLDIRSGSDRRRLLYVGCSRAMRQLHLVRVDPPGRRQARRRPG